jgi:hypothetical protein
VKAEAGGGDDAGVTGCDVGGRMKRHFFFLVLDGNTVGKGGDCTVASG